MLIPNLSSDARVQTDSLSRGEDANSQYELSRGNQKEQFITVMGAEVRYRLDAIHSGRFSRIDIVHHYWYHWTMPSIEKIIAAMRNNPKAVRFDDASKVCEYYFGAPRNNGTSHHVYRTPWQGEPYVIIQRGHDGNAKAYQVRQILRAIDKKEGK